MWTSLKPEKSYWFLFGMLVFYVLLAYNSSGYHHPDEHYQIIEFASYKLGKTAMSDLAWEFGARIRPGLQPALCYLLFKGASLLGITDVYDLAFILRLISAVLSVFIIRLFILSARPVVDKDKYNHYIVLSYLLWFLPYINVRFSSESWSGLFFLASLSVIQFNRYQNSIKNLVLIGTLFGISMLFRYQSGLLAMGAVLWLLWISKLAVRKVAVIIASIIAVLVAGFFIDRWLYGVYSFTLYNYFYVNIIEGVSSNYGVSPWYGIMLYIIKAPGPMGVLIFASILILLVYTPKNLLIWSMLPFLVVHSFIPHKELRFLFPIANVAPLVLVLAWQQMSHVKVLQNKNVRYAVVVLLILINTAGLIATASKGAGPEKISIAQYIYRNYHAKKVNIIYVDDLNPYTDGSLPKNTFYNNPEVELTPITTIWEDGMTNKKKAGYTNLLVISDNEITGPRTITLFKNLHLIKVYQSIPWIVQKINGYYNPSLNDAGLMLYEFKSR